MSRYSNCLMVGPDNVPLCRVDLKRAKWYVVNNLASWTKYPEEFKINFKPNGKGACGDPFYLQHKPNRCVVCGKEKSLTKHHVVPYQYRCRFHDRYRCHTSHDVFLLCRDCHSKYEIHAKKLKEELFGDQERLLLDLFEKYRIAVRNASTLLKHKDKIPEEGQRHLKSKIERIGVSTDNKSLAAFLKQFATKNDINNDAIDAKIGFAKLYKEIFDRMSENDLYEFVVKWRKHFVDIMQPKYMLPHWNIYKKIVQND